MMAQGCLFVGSLSCAHREIERRPYHRNCSCALHRLKGDTGEAAAAACGLHKKNVSFSKKRPWNHCCLRAHVNASSHEDFSSQSSLLDSSSSIGNVRDSMKSLASSDR